ncbi:MLO-like protein 9 isoform X2 [Vitis vinifera]|uniref:MLO-like protein 9 isoform X2 n=1 Tax=Vitis vinifera TaxID=29760 RepID=UPI002882FB0C|nr:MLO-like protein 9 isoform X2 [Vitis vinifera]
MGEGEGNSRELDQTPTWAVAAVCAVIILISIILEKVLHLVGELFQRRRKKALYEALEKVKGELMILGFISLLLTFGQNYISKICIPSDLADTMLPCPSGGQAHHEAEHKPEPAEGEHHRKLLWNEHRFLSVESEGVVCKETRAWKEWERETEYDNDAARFRLTHETSFVRDHSSFWTKTPFLFVIVCFFRQFFRSVRKADYLTMRHGFVTVHLAPGSKFNFQKYIKRSLEDDFKVVVGISPVLWASVVVFLLLNVHGWEAMFWISIFPLVVILAVGTKLQAIITNMALEIQEKHAVVQGIPLVKVSDRHFWFSWPQLVLYLIHFTLFLNAFEITYFFWIWYEFGLKSCFHSDFDLIILRVAIGVGVQIMCSYITLPLYALVTQMGSTMKRAIFDEQTSRALKKWHMNAQKKKNEGKPEHGPTRTLGGSPGDSPVNTPSAAHPHFTNTAGQSDHCLPVAEADAPSSNQAANIMTSIDLRDQQQDSPPDLLTGP